MTAGTLFRRFSCTVLLALVTPGAGFVRAADEPAKRNLGIEGTSTVVLPRGDYQVRPVDDRSELLLDIESITPLAAGGYRYKIHFMGMEPGDYSLVGFLMLADGGRPGELKDFRLKVRSELPEDHDGKLAEMTPAPFPFIGGYRVFLGCLAVLWVTGIILFIRSYRKKKTVEIPVIVAPEPGFAERIRPLVESAAAGTITLEDQTILERLLMGFWREKLCLTENGMAGNILELKRHPVAGELLRAMERWLHRQGGSSAGEINALLDAYRAPPASSSTGEVAA
jgi:hypothetical protein